MWLRVLEAVDEEHGNELAQQAANGVDEFDHREMTLTLLGMHAALQLVSQGLQEMVLGRVETLEPRDEGRPRPESDEEEVEVPIKKQSTQPCTRRP